MPDNPPIGSIVPFAGSVENFNEAQENYLVCDGRRLRKRDYQALAAVIAGTWGGDDTNYFHLPDLRGQFLRGVDKDKAGRETDPPRDVDRGDRYGFEPPTAPTNPGNRANNVGSFQPHQFATHSHNITDRGHTHDLKYGILADGRGGYGVGGGQGGSDTHDHGDRKTTTSSGTGISINESGGRETRPVNAYVYWLIRYR